MDYVRLSVIVPALRVLIVAAVDRLALQIVLLLVIPTASIVATYAARNLEEDTQILIVLMEVSIMMGVNVIARYHRNMAAAPKSLQILR